MTIRAALFLPIAMDFVGSVVAVAERHEDSRVGYSIEVPDGWVAMSPAQLQVFQRFLENIGDQSQYVAGFQSPTASGEVEPPYLLMQWLPYRVYGLQQQPTTEDIRSMSEPILAGGAADYLKDIVDLSKVGVEFDTDVSELQPGLDMERKRLTYGMQIAAQGQTIYGAAVMEFGREASVQALYYTNDRSDLTADGAALRTLQTFAMTPSAKWQENLDHGGTSEPNRSRSILRGAVVGAIIGGFVGLLIWFVRR